MKVQIDGVEYVPKAILPTDDITLAVMLKTLRKSIGYTLMDIEKQTGLSNAFLCKMEHGKAEPSLRTAAKLAKVFGVPIERLAAALPHNVELRG